MRDELGYQVDAAGVVTLLGEEVRPVSRPAAGVDDRAVDLRGPAGHESVIEGMNRGYRSQGLDVLRRSA